MVFRPVPAWIYMRMVHSPMKSQVTSSGMWLKRLFCSPPLLLGEVLFGATMGLGVSYVAHSVLKTVWSTA